MLIYEINELPASPLRLAGKHGLRLRHQKLVQLALLSELLMRVHHYGGAILFIIPQNLLIKLINIALDPAFDSQHALSALAQLL